MVQTLVTQLNGYTVLKNKTKQNHKLAAKTEDTTLKSGNELLCHSKSQVHALTIKQRSATQQSAKLFRYFLQMMLKRARTTTPSAI